MKYNTVLLYALLICIGCGHKKKNDSSLAKKDTIEKNEINVYNFQEFESFLNKVDHKTYVVNFWATWCKPCVKELPYFEELHKNYSKKNVEVILVSLDMESQIESKLKPFLKKNKLKSKVLVLDDPDADAWITKVDTSWSGAIPATVIYNKENRNFYEKSFTYETLEEALNKL